MQGLQPYIFNVYTGLYNGTASPTVDTNAYGSGILDGRFVQVSPGSMIDALTSYTYDIGLKTGLTLTDTAKAAGWTEDATGYHLTITKANNPVTDTNYLVSISFKIADGTQRSAIIGNQQLNVKATYNKIDGTSYSHTATIAYNVKIPQSKPPNPEYLTFTQLASGDSEILVSKGEGYYTTRLQLNNLSPVENVENLSNYSLVEKTNNSNEFISNIVIQRDYVLDNLLNLSQQLLLKVERASTSIFQMRKY